MLLLLARHRSLHFVAALSPEAILFRALIDLSYLKLAGKRRYRRVFDLYANTTLSPVDYFQLTDGQRPLGKAEDDGAPGAIAEHTPLIALSVSFH